MGPIIGIDLGTTFSSVAFLNAYGRAEVIPTLDGRSSVPSVVLFEPGSGTPVVGMSAKERSVEAPDRVVEFVKREMGDPDWVFRLDGKELRPQTISGMILRRLVGMAEGALGARPEAAVITCPAYFGDLERQATADAGKLAGLNVQAVFNEPTAAALAYGLHHAAKGERVTALVYDLGGGTFDVTVLQMHGRQVQVLATAGEHRLGGKDWDDELLNYVAEEFLVEFGSDPRDDLASMQDLRNRCEAAKIVLSKKSKARVFARAHGQTLKVEISRALFDELTRPLLLQTRTYLDEVLQRAKKRWDDIDVVLPVGGSSHMPQVKKLLGDCMGRAPEAVVDPDLAVVQGATYYAALLRAQEGFEIKCFATSQPRGRVAKQADSDELPALPPAKMEDAPEVLPALPGAVGSAPPADDAAVFAIPMLPGAVGPPRKGAQTRRRPTGPQRPPTRRRPARSGDTIAGSLPGAPAEAVAGSLPPSGRPAPGRRPSGKRPPPGKRPPARRPQAEMAGALPPSSADSMAMGISPIDPTHTAVFDFADVLVLLDEDEAPASNAPVAPPKQQMVLQVNARPLSVLVHQKGQPATSVMIASNTKLPAHKRQRFFTINDGQTGVKLVVLEGDNPDPEQCTRIGECIVSGLPARPKGQPVEVGYSYNEDGRIEVWALDLGTGRQAKSELKRAASLTASEWDQAAAIVNGVLGG